MAVLRTASISKTTIQRDDEAAPDVAGLGVPAVEGAFEVALVGGLEGDGEGDGESPGRPVVGVPETRPEGTPPTPTSTSLRRLPSMPRTVTIARSTVSTTPSNTAGTPEASY
jgi:hypothetical protein